MWTLLQAIGLNKWLAYAAMAASVIGAVAIIATRLRASGASAERTRQLQNTLRTLNKEAQERAKIEAMRTADARQRMRDRWSSR